MALLRLVLIALPFLAWVAYSYVKRIRFQQFKNIPRLSPSLVWGHMKLINEYMVKQGSEKHIGMFPFVQYLKCDSRSFRF
jgi:hypothetical protein